MNTAEKLTEVNKFGKLHQGRKEYINILNGKSSTWKSRSLAMCYDCMGYYVDGKADCGNELCPLYVGMPYRHNAIMMDDIPEIDGTTDEDDDICENLQPTFSDPSSISKWGLKKLD